MAPSLAVLAIVEVFCETLLYGVYCVLFAMCLHILVFNRKGELKLPLVLVSLALFTCITIHEVIDAGRLIWVFSNFSTMAEVDTWYSAGLTHVWNILNNSAYVVETVVSDLFLLYRCYIVWGKKKRVIALPALVFLVGMGAGIALPISLSHFKGSNLVNPSFVQKQENIDTTYFSSTFALNAMCTSLIAYRILKNQGESHPFRTGSESTRLSKVAVVVIESGAIYLVSLALLLSTYVRKSTVNYVFLDIVVPTIGIVFSLIIVRIGLNISYEATSNGPTLPTLRFADTTTGISVQTRSMFPTTDDSGSSEAPNHHTIEPQSSSGTLRDVEKQGVVHGYDLEMAGV
ncbi:hypothetical protein PENSPDRAFT_689981 [Peniophora sp. CONT]|nr:hypothetical protein PENSPDRAFT_689981 [Peniophora sp. CONT]